MFRSTGKLEDLMLAKGVLPQEARPLIAALNNYPEFVSEKILFTAGYPLKTLNGKKRKSDLLPAASHAYKVAIELAQIIQPVLEDAPIEAATPIFLQTVDGAFGHDCAEDKTSIDIDKKEASLGRELTTKEKADIRQRNVDVFVDDQLQFSMELMEKHGIGVDHLFGEWNPQRYVSALYSMLTQGKMRRTKAGISYFAYEETVYTLRDTDATNSFTVIRVPDRLRNIREVYAKHPAVQQLLRKTNVHFDSLHQTRGQRRRREMQREYAEKWTEAVAKAEEEGYSTHDSVGHTTEDIKSMIIYILGSHYKETREVQERSNPFLLAAVDRALDHLILGIQNHAQTEAKRVAVFGNHSEDSIGLYRANKRDIREYLSHPDSMKLQQEPGEGIFRFNGTLARSGRLEVKSAPAIAEYNDTMGMQDAQMYAGLAAKLMHAKKTGNVVPFTNRLFETLKPLLAEAAKERE